jgi:hypothetical protein
MAKSFAQQQMCFQHVPDALTAEALATRDGVLLARACGLEKVILETNNLHLWNLLCSQAGERSSIAGLWQEIKVLGREFSCFQFSFVNREGNEAAHLCAKLCSESSPNCLWPEAFPVGLLGIAEVDWNPASD